jgi:leader peptidase (prepilin peptidase)/N-methyltransferase
MPFTLLTALAGLLGLAVGSFLNVVIHRVPRGESVVRPGSRCPRCETPLRTWHNLPVLSWIVLRGRCAHCGDRIGVRYPAIELATAVLFVAVTARVGFTAALPAFLYLAAIAVALTVIDLDTKRLPNRIVLPSYGVAGVLLAVAAAADGDWGSAVRAVLAMGVLLAVYFVIWFVYPPGMGWGDVKLAGVLGLYLGWIGWGAVAVGAYAAFLLGGVVGLAMMVARRAGRKSKIPFGPYMLTGAMLALFATTPLISWYHSLLVPTA